MSLYRAETRRLVKRRFTKIFVIGGLLVLAAVLVAVFLTNQKVTPDTRAAAAAAAQEDYQSQLASTAQLKQDCEAAQGTSRATEFPPCEQISEPTPDSFRPEYYMPATFDFRESFSAMVTTLAALLGVVAFVVGASFVGAEWTSGGMMNLLLWRPQRVRVLATKLAALLMSLTALTVVVSALWTGAFLQVANLRGSSGSMTPGAWRSIGLLELRALAVVLVAAAFGFGLASLGRHTAMALGVAIGLVVVFQFGLGAVLEMAKVPFVDAYLIPVWLIAWMQKSYTSEDYESCNFDPTGGCQPDTFTITWQMSGSVMAAIFVVIVGAALWTIRSRDIT